MGDKGKKDKDRASKQRQTKKLKEANRKLQKQTPRPR
jgi:hypothetical protein